jgi:hypothetical protein
VPVSYRDCPLGTRACGTCVAHARILVVAVPVLLATTAHVVGAQLRWRRRLSERVGRAQGFYAVLIASIGLSGRGPHRAGS